MRLAKISGCAAGSLLLAAIVQAQPHPSFERGFAPEKMYQFDNVDSVSLLNGNAIISIPIGPSYPVSERLLYRLTLVGNTKVWDHRQIGSCDEPIPVRQANAGMGWRLSLGTLLSPTDAANVDDLGYWVYIGSDGAVHRFYSTLHTGETPDPNGYYLYSRDGSYLRMRYISSMQRAIEFPDGLFQTYQLQTWPGGYYEWRIIGITDRYNDRPGGLPNVLIQYPTATTMQISDQHGRVQTITFQSDSTGWYPRLVQRVDLTAFNGGTATYSFSYVPQQTISVPAVPGICSGWTSVTVPQLYNVSLPDGTSWGIQTYTSGNYSTGATSGLWFPTGGHISYAYGLRVLPVEACSSRRWLSQSGAVSSRTFYDAAGGSLGSWTYSALLYTQPQFAQCEGKPTMGPEEEERVTVVSPLDQKTVHYFSVFPGWAGNGTYPGSFLIEEYGLPLSRYPASDGGSTPRFLSFEQFDCNNCTANPKRQTYVRYERDTGIGCGLALNPDCLNSNRRLAAERTLYRDDPDTSCTAYPNSTCRTATTDYSSFDGLGHYRTVTTGGNFGVGDQRISTTNFNPSSGTYPGSYIPWPTSSPWVLDTYADQTVTESSVTAKTESCFDPSTGYLRARRTLLGSTQASTDLLAVYTPDTAGNTIKEQYFGGDTQVGALPANYCSFPIQALTGQQYRIDQTYQNGARKTSRYYDASGNPSSFYLLDQDIDARTGLASRTRDSAGIYADFTYDTSNRLTWVKPQTSFNGGAWVQYAYTNASGSIPARVNAYLYANNTTTPALAQTEYTFDALGRLAKERQLLPGAVWNQRLHSYNLMGWTTGLSEWQPDGTSSVYQTSYAYCGDHDWNPATPDACDPFGRPLTITPPDGTAHDVKLRYTGVRVVDRKVKIGTSKDGSNNIIESSSTTTEVYDRQGRLYQVLEPSRADGSNETTIYGYDIGNRLVKVCTPSSGDPQCTNPTGPYPPQQLRTSTYDKRGFLTSEQLPEKGALGNGTVTYSLYDARGHAGRVVDGDSSRDLTFSYEPAERLTQVRETNTPQRTLKAFTYCTLNGTTPDGGADYCNGKLKTATRNNYYDGTANFPVVETYYYGDVAGRVSHRVTNVLSTNITAKLTTKDWGDVATIQYPQVPGVGSARTVAQTYDNGWLTGITGYATISYWTNGMLNTIAHANGVTDSYGKDPNDMRRPASIATAGAASNWSSGIYKYDGAGNIVKIGADYNLYDKVSRVVTGAPRAAAYTQSYTYDAFGNITSIITNGGAPVNTVTTTATNHLTGATYDAAGNVTAYQGFAYYYDAFNQQRQLTGTGLNQYYYYAADGERVGFKDQLTGVTTFTLRGVDNKPLREYTYNGSAWSWSKDYVWRQGNALAVIDAAGTRHFALDHLGTVRLITNSDTGKTVWGYHAYYPFGEEAGTTWDAERIKFTGHERDLHGTPDTLDDLDYMHARYYKPVSCERLLSVDPIDGVSRYPQSWNRYAYARGNPLKYTDPTGMYIAECAAGDKQCLADLEAFEKARQANLASKDASIAAAAAAYGDPGVDNGVTLAFADPGTGKAGSVTPDVHGNVDGTMSMTASVVMRPGLKGTELRAAVAHEGQHLLDAQRFVASFTLNAASWDVSRNLTQYQTEMNAFRLTHAVYSAANERFSTGCSGCRLGADAGVQTPADVDRAIKRILANPSGLYKLSPTNQGQHQFQLWADPPAAP